MNGLLIHSMSEFSELIFGCMADAGVRNIAEIGSEFGGMSQLLSGFAANAGGRLSTVDPAPKQAFRDWVSENAHVSHFDTISLQAIPRIRDTDAWLIDGDHNWYTVINELRLIDENCRRDGRPLLAFLHDVAWPCGRRDFYYAPEQIPPDFRHPHSFDHGVHVDDKEIHEGRGFRGAGQFAIATHQGGPRNGVLTAVEDFLAETRVGERELAFALVPAVFGLGVVFDATAPWASSIAARLLPLHDNRLIATLEQNRLRNYLAVIDWQDRHAA